MPWRKVKAVFWTGLSWNFMMWTWNITLPKREMLQVVFGTFPSLHTAKVCIFIYKPKAWGLLLRSGFFLKMRQEYYNITYHCQDIHDMVIKNNMYVVKLVFTQNPQPWYMNTMMVAQKSHIWSKNKLQSLIIKKKGYWTVHQVSDISFFHLHFWDDDYTLSLFIW